MCTGLSTAYEMAKAEQSTAAHLSMHIVVVADYVAPKSTFTRCLGIHAVLPERRKEWAYALNDENFCFAYQHLIVYGHLAAQDNAAASRVGVCVWQCTCRASGVKTAVFWFITQAHPCSELE